MTEVCDVRRREVKAAGRQNTALVTLRGQIWMGARRGFDLSYVIENKGNVNASSQQRKRIVAAWVCLLTAAFLYAPLAAASWSAHAMACCTGDYCPIAQHHHPKRPASHSEMDCGHDMGEMMDCSMSCCPRSENPLVTAIAFVLPHMISASANIAVTGAAGSLQALEIPRSLEPISPPPRFAHTL